MKRLLYLIVSIISTCHAFAQGYQTATLLHDGEHKVFHSSDALVEAVKEAEHGDVITLSPGMFNSTNITKGITIRGAGSETLDSLLISPATTILKGDYSINITDSTSSQRLYIEGICHTQSTVRIDHADNSVFVKTQFNVIQFKDPSSSEWRNLSFIHCYIKGGLSNPENCTAIFNNSVICGLTPRGTSTEQFSFNHCVISSDFTYQYINNCYIENTIIRNINASSPASLTSKNNVCVNSILCGPHDDNPFPDSNTSNSNIAYDNSTDILIANSFFRLSDEAKQHKASDGSEIGIYGGTNPFSILTTYPQIVKLDVAPESSSDGTLKVHLEINSNPIK